MLPIEKHLPAIIDQVSAQQATLLEASPGSGKTTLVPLELMKKFSGKILVLEPRRLATKWAAERAAQLLGEKIGQSVGYIYRFDKKVSDQTRLIFLTEGSFLKYLQSDSALKDVSVVVIDEFHERHLNTDIAFGLIKKFNHPHLKLLIMSATLDEKPLKKFFPDLAKMTITAPVFPLEIRWSPDEAEWLKRDLEKKVLWGIQQALTLEGDILVFLPGLGEIKRIHSILEERLASHPHLLLTLHGQESSEESLILNPQSLRKIILASNVAESSITIPGIKIVIDSGLQREAHFLERSSRTELVTLPCSQASAIQRAGRAARTGSGLCIRLYTEKDFNSRPAYTTPEVLIADLAEVMLELAWWNIKLEDFSWINSPDFKKIQFAKELLDKLGALENSALSPIGKEMLQVPLTPKVARVWVEAKRLGTQRSFNETCGEISNWIEKGANKKRLEDRLKSFKASGSQDHCEIFWLSGFEDSIARYRQDKLNTVRGESYSLSFEARKNFNPNKNFWLVMDVNPVTKQAMRLLPLEDEWVKARATGHVEIINDENKSQSLKRTSLKIGSLTLESSDEILNSNHITQSSLENWIQDFKSEENFIRWTLFQKAVAPEKSLIDFEWELFIEECLLDVRDLTKEKFFHLLSDELQLYIDHTFHFTLKNVCPKEFLLHEKKQVPVHYELNQNPWIGSYIQDFFGLQSHPQLGLKKLPLTLHLWGPHGRALQVTGDLLGFWERHYPDLKRELSRDYPRHFWPIDPLKAEPILRIPRKKS